MICLSRSTGIWFALHWSKMQAVCKANLQMDCSALQYCITFLWLTDYLRAKNTCCCSLYLIGEITLCSEHIIWMLGTCSSCGQTSGGPLSLHKCAWHTNYFLVFGCTCGSSIRDHGACCPGNSTVSSFVPSVWVMFLRGAFYQLRILTAWTKIGSGRTCAGTSWKRKAVLSQTDDTGRPPEPRTILVQRNTGTWCSLQLKVAVPPLDCFLKWRSFILSLYNKMLHVFVST